MEVGIMGTVDHTDLCVLFPADLTHMIHILDTEHPWEVHSVSSGHSEAITCLEWDQSGEAMSLLSIQSPGQYMPPSSVISPKSRAWGQPPPTGSPQWGGGTEQFTCPSEGLLTQLFHHRVPAPVC